MKVIQLRLVIRMPSNARNRNSGTHELNKSQHELKTGRRATFRVRKAKDWDETEKEREKKGRRQVVVYHAGQDYSQAEATFEWGLSLANVPWWANTYTPTTAK